jgi:transcriptional regulator GlxA family with amidase domain
LAARRDYCPAGCLRSAPRSASEDPARTYLDFLREQASRARMMCAVCDGAMLLAAAGLLDGYQATAHWAFTSCFPQRFPKCRWRRAIRASSMTAIA